MPDPFAAPNDPWRSLRAAMKRHWGFDGFLPLQREAMEAVLAGRDSLVVMATGSGKSLCFQAPASCVEGLAVVVSPLIALMKDQVDGLRACGVAAAAANSTLSADERRDVAQRIASGELKLLYVSPERLLAERTLEFLKTQRIAYFAVDEAHCISAWGHDFRPEYRELSRLREHFPGTPVHAYTATATPQVRDDIVAQLSLHDPETLVGDFRRPNLEYHVAKRDGGLNQICSVLDRHRGQSAIVYCITRNEVDKTARALVELGYKAAPYHAGMADGERTRNQEDFLTERIETIVATIAFGMGIDKSNVRCVVHLGMPKSLENYQQESGRAGRDGLPAECWLIHSSQDFITWRQVQSDLPAAAREGAESSLRRISDYCTSVSCRHRGLIEHFGQAWSGDSCGACDVCLGQLQTFDDALVVGQKILSCVLRVQERFGGDYVAQVLVGSREQRILANQHDRLSTWGLLKDHRRQDVREWIEQLVGQRFLLRVGEYHVLQVTDEGRRLLRGEVTPTLLRPARRRERVASAAAVESWEGVDRGLFDLLRELRSAEAERRNVPAYIVFSDATLRDLARRRPASAERMLEVTGVGERKLAEFGPVFLLAIADYCHEKGLATDVVPERSAIHERGAATDDDPGSRWGAPAERKPRTAGLSAGALESFEYFDQGWGVPQVAEKMKRATSTVYQYLETYIRCRGITDPTRWIAAHDLEQVAVVVQYAGAERLKHIYDALHGQVDYDTIRIAVTALANRANESDVEREG